jgi:glutaredoxin
MEKELVMYGRRFACSDQSNAMWFLEANEVPYRFVDIGADKEAAERLIQWTGFKSVPTIVIAKPGEVLPVEEPTPLNSDHSARGVDRQTVITEPSNSQLEDFLKKHSLL